MDGLASATTAPDPRTVLGFDPLRRMSVRNRCWCGAYSAWLWEARGYFYCDRHAREVAAAVSAWRGRDIQAAS